MPEQQKFLRAFRGLASNNRLSNTTRQHLSGEPDTHGNFSSALDGIIVSNIPLRHTVAGLVVWNFFPAHSYALYSCWFSAEYPKGMDIIDDKYLFIGNSVAHIGIIGNTSAG
jgi:hypothetical protein